MNKPGFTSLSFLYLLCLSSLVYCSIPEASNKTKNELVEAASALPSNPVTFNAPDRPPGFQLMEYFTEDSVKIIAPDCSSFIELCLNITSGELPDLIVTNNGLPYPSSGYVSCSDSLLAMELPVGVHQISITNQVNGMTDTLLATVVCTSTDTLFSDIRLHRNDTICLGYAQLFGLIDTVYNACPDGSVASYEVIQDSCIVISGDWVGQETACMVACDQSGICDTTIVFVNVLHPLPNGVKDTIVPMQERSFCFDPDDLNIQGPIESMLNICIPSTNGPAEFTLDMTKNCLNYLGEMVGTDSACIQLCDAAGNCDTITVCVSIVPGNIVSDSVFVSVDTGIYCLESSFLPGTIIDVQDICADENGEDVVFTIEGTCVTYTGVQEGIDTACLRFTDQFGNVALTHLIVTVYSVSPLTFTDTVFVGQTGEYCLDTMELPGTIVDFEEICPGAQNGNVAFFTDPLSLCISYEGLFAGVDSICMVICDDLGFCDTSFLHVNVVPYFDLPALTPDTTLTEKATPVVIDFLGNDTIFGGLVDVFILDPPISGSVTLNLDNSVTYIPDDPFCARWDQFSYVACNPNGCDTTNVNIFIECIELTVFNAVSPNNDNLNDNFFIAKLEDFPDNRLWVYNRWGNLVFEEESYRNNWPGSWGDDIDLPEGTYYYILEWRDGENTTVQRGFFELFR